MHAFRSKPIALALGLVLFCLVAVAAETVTLRVRPDVGATDRFVLTQEQSMTMNMGPMGQQTTDATNRLEMTQVVREVGEAGDVTLEFTYDRAVMEVKTPQGSMTYDSAAEDADPDNPMGMLIGKPIGVTLSERALVKDVSGLDTMFDEMIAEGGDGAAMAPVVEMLRTSFSDESMAQTFQQSFPVLPEDPVGTGSTWTWSGEMSNPAFGTMKLDQSFEVLGFEERSGSDCVKAAVTLTMVHDGGFPLLDTMREGMAAQGQQMDLSASLGDAGGSGTVWIDRATGMTVAMDTTSTFDMTMELGMPGMPADAPNGGKMKMEMAMTVRQIVERAE
jgi:hypothetical protein